MERLLGYHGRRYWLTNGWSLWFRVWPVVSSATRPHGLRYSFTLHDVDGTRLLGFDNSHAANRTVVAYDHRHRFRRTETIAPYAFSDADGLIADFFDAVRRACASEGVDLEIDGEDMFLPGGGKEAPDAEDAE